MIRRACARAPIGGSGDVAIFPALGQLIVEEALRCRGARLVERAVYQVDHGRRWLRLVFRLPRVEKTPHRLVIIRRRVNDNRAEGADIDRIIPAASLLACLLGYFEWSEPSLSVVIDTGGQLRMTFSALARKRRAALAFRRPI